MRPRHPRSSDTLIYFVVLISGNLRAVLMLEILYLACGAESVLTLTAYMLRTA